jgi:hypothetical protein
LIKDFIKEDGHLLFFSIFNAPAIPYDFCESRDGYGIRGLVVQFMDSNNQTVIGPLLTATKEILDEIAHCPMSLPVFNVTNKEAFPEDFDMLDFNRLLSLYSRLLSHLSLLQSVYNVTTNMQGRPSVPFTPPFNLPQNIDMLTEIGNVIRYVFLFQI